MVVSAFLQAVPREDRVGKMKVTIEIDCTPAEARSFMGLPDVSTLNDHLVQEMKNRIDANLHMLQPEELLKNWMNFGGQAQESFMQLMRAAASQGRG
jgi:hypothetical protein